MSKKPTIRQILSGTSVTIVAKKDGKKKQKDLPYDEALEAKKLFKQKGYEVWLYQIGFNN